MYFQSMGLLKESESQSDRASKIPKKCCPVVSGKFSFWASTFFILNCLMGNWQKAHQLPTKSLQEQTKVFFFLSEPWVKSIRGKMIRNDWLFWLYTLHCVCYTMHYIQSLTISPSNEHLPPTMYVMLRWESDVDVFCFCTKA